MTTLVLVPPVLATSPSRPAVLGDGFANPIYLVGSAGALSVSFRFAGYEVAEVELEGGDDGTVWLDWVAPAAGDLTLDASGAVIEVYQGDGVGSLVLVGAGTDSVDMAVSVRGVYKIRLRAAAGGTSATLTWAFTARANPVLLFVEDVQQTPGSLLVMITNGDPDQDVTLSVDGQAVSVPVTLDDAGTAIGQAVLLDVALAAGSYVLRAVHPGRADATATFAVLLDPEPTQDTLPPPAPSSTVPGSVVLVNNHYVRRFVLQDKLVGGLGDYVLPRNPTSMTSPYPDNVLLVEPTLAPDGQLITWEGARRSKAWSWSGYLDEQAQFDAMLGFSELNRRFYVIDHRNRAWVVSFEAFDPEPVRNIDKPWAHNYKAELLIHDGPFVPGV